MKTLDFRAFRKSNITFLFFLLSSLLITLILFFFDEGKYSLAGLFEMNNIGGLAFYFLLVLGPTLLMYNLIKERVKRTPAIMISILLGPVTCFLFLFGMMYLFRLILSLY